MWKQCGFFDHLNYIEESTWKQRGIFEQRNYINKALWKQRVFFDHRNYIEKVRGNYVGFSTIKITSKKIAEMTGTLVQVWSSTYRQNIHLKLTWIRRGVPFREPSEGFEYTPTLYEKHGKKYKKRT